MNPNYVFNPKTFATSDIMTDVINNLPVIIAIIIILFIIILFVLPKIGEIIFPNFSFSSFARYIPFSKPSKDNYSVYSGNNTISRVFSFYGVQTDIQTEDQKQQFLDMRAMLLEQIKDPNVIVRIFMIREGLNIKTDYKFDDVILQKIYNQWNEKAVKIFNNKYYIVLTVFGNDIENKIATYSDLVETILSAYKPKLLKNNEENNFASFYSKILSPITKPVIKQVNKNMNDLMISDGIEFLNNGNILFTNGDVKKYGAIISFKISPDFLDEDFYNSLGTIPCELLTMNALNFINSQKTEKIINQKISGLESNQESSDIAEKQISEALSQMDENISGNQNLLSYYPMILLYSNSEDELNQNIKYLNQICARFGITAVTENYATKVSWFSMLAGYDTFPRNFKLLSKTAAICFPMSVVPTGLSKSDWGEGPIVIFPTHQGTPYMFQFHVSENPNAVGHTLTIGPTGQGKTTLFSFLISQSMRHSKLKTFFFDRNRGAEIFTLSVGGKYITFENRSQESDNILAGFKAKLNPLKIEDSNKNRDFLRRWLSLISEQDSAIALEEIGRSVSINFDYLSKDKRLLKDIYTSCFSANGGMREALKKWVDPLQYGSIFNEDEDTLDLFSRLTTFDFTEILNDETLSPAVISYIIQRINTITTSGGNPSLIMIDETAPMLANPMFRQNFITGLQEGRKNRQAYMAAFQQANILDKLGIGDVVRGQAQTMLFFRNPGADSSDYAHWKLNPKEMAFIQGQAYPELKRAILLSRPVSNESVILNTELDGLGNYLKLFESGRRSVLLVEELYKKMGSDFVETYLKRNS